MMKKFYFLFAMSFFCTLSIVQADDPMIVITVNSTADIALDSATCDPSVPGGQCTLRAAIARAGTLSASSSNTIYRIDLGVGEYGLELGIGGVPETISATDLDVVMGGTGNQLVIRGEALDRTIVRSNMYDRMFDIHSGNVTIENMTLRGMDVSGIGSLFTVAPGGIHVRSAATVTLRRVRVTGTSLPNYNSFAFCGIGIKNDGGRLIIQKSKIDNNNAGISSFAAFNNEHNFQLYMGAGEFVIFGEN